MRHAKGHYINLTPPQRFDGRCDHQHEFSGGVYWNTRTLLRAGKLELARCDVCKVLLIGWGIKSVYD